MRTKKSWKPLLGIVGLVLLMMTAASVCAEEPLDRETQAPDEGATMEYPDANEGDVEPLLIATEETSETDTSGLPDYGNYTGDMLISPGPEATSEANTLGSLPIVGAIGAVVCIVLVIIGLFIRRKK